MKHYKIKIGILFIGILLAFSSCKKFIELDAPVTSLSEDNVYESDYSAISVLTAIYIDMSNSQSGDDRITSMSLYAELCADNLRLFDLSAQAYLPYYQNNLRARSLSFNRPPEYWNWFYTYIYQTNAAIEGLAKSTTLSPEVKSRLLGEAMFMRAFCYFYLVELYGDVPLVLNTNYKSNATLGRTAKQRVYGQMIQDLKVAQGLLTDEYQDVTLLKGTAERIRPNKGAATALLSRAYLYMGDYQNAEQQAGLLIDNNPLYKLLNIDDVFKMNSQETIWSLQPVRSEQNTWEALRYILPPTGPSSGGSSRLVSNELLRSFDTDDLRLSAWIGNVTANGVKYYYPHKYKAGANAEITEYEMVLRLAEQYLIRGEARAMQGKLIGIGSASSDLNTIRARAGLLPTTSTTKPELLEAILKERQRELFTEWGHRWFDLKRTGKIDAVMSVVCPLKGGVWQPYKALFPIPQTEIEVNIGMAGQQNPGYIN